MSALAVEILSTACIKSGGTGYVKDDTNYHWFGTHYAGNTYYTGWRCRVAESDLPPDPSTIDSFVLTIEPNTDQANQSNGEFTVVVDAVDWDGTTNSPMGQWDATYGTVTWNPSGWTKNVDKAAPDISSVAADVIDNATVVSGYRYFAIIWKPGVPTAVGTVQVYGSAHPTSSYRPFVTATFPAPPNFTATIDQAINITVASIGERAYMLDTLNYYGSFNADLYQPLGTPKSASGWPVAVWIHGGRFVTGGRGLHATNENYLAPDWLNGLLDSGIAVLSIDYSRSAETALEINANHSSHPLAIKDVKTAIKYIQARASTASGGDNTYNINAKGMALAAHSAGTQIALMAALTVGDTAVYSPGRENTATNGTWGDGRNAYQSTSWGGGYPETYTFTYAPWGGTAGTSPHTAANTNTDIEPLVGVFLYAPLWDLYGAQAVGAGNIWAIRAYMGRSAYLGAPAISNVTYNREGDPGDYCSPTTTDSIHYDGRGATTKRPPSSLGPNSKYLPIAVAWSDDDTIIPPTYGATAMNNFYIAEGLTVGSIKTMSSADQTVLTPADVEKEGLTRIKLPAGTIHEHVTFDSSPTDFVTWMNTVMAGTFYVMEPSGIKRVNPIGIMEGTPTASLNPIEYPGDIEFHSKHSNP